VESDVRPGNRIVSRHIAAASRSIAADLSDLVPDGVISQLISPACHACLDNVTSRSQQCTHAQPEQ